MSTTLEPVLQALGYASPVQQRDFVKLLQASGAFGELPGVNGVLDDRQAEAILKNVTFDTARQAAHWLHEITQEHMLRRPPGAERYECEEPEHFKQHRAELLQALNSTGQLADAKPTTKHYDHVLLLGAMESTVDTRLDTLKQLWNEGVRFDKIHLLGSDRPLVPERERSVRLAIGGKPAPATEMEMMESRYYRKGRYWPKELRRVDVYEVNTQGTIKGQRANTRDTIESWLTTVPEAGSVLAISDQPYVRYQDAAVKSVLPPEFRVETVGSGAPPDDIKVSVAMDSIARQIDVGFEKLLETLKTQKRGLGTPLFMIDPATIQTDAATYQFRSGGDAAGVTKKGRFQAAAWDPVLHGDPLLVHERLDGSLFVADGHHRLELANRLNAEGKGPGNIAVTVLREADGYSAQDAKIVAAYKNMAHGQCDTVDTARVFKEAYSGQVHTALLPQLQMDKGNLKLSFTLSGLSDKTLDKVAEDALPAEMAAEVAARVRDPGRQDALISLISEKLHQSYDMRRAPYEQQVQVSKSPLIDIIPMRRQPPLDAGHVAKLMRQRAKHAMSQLSA